MNDRFYKHKLGPVVNQYLKEKYTAVSPKNADNERKELTRVFTDRIFWARGEAMPSGSNLQVSPGEKTELVKDFIEWFEKTHPDACKDPMGLGGGDVDIEADMKKLIREALQESLAAQAVPAIDLTAIGNMVQSAIQASVPDPAAISRFIEAKVDEKMARTNEKMVEVASVQYTALKDKLAGAAVDSINEGKASASAEMAVSIDLIKEAGDAIEKTNAEKLKLTLENAEIREKLAISEKQEEASKKEAEASKKEAEASKKDAEASKKDAEASKKNAEASKKDAETFTKVTDNLREQLRKLAVANGMTLVDNAHFNRAPGRDHEETDRRGKSKLASAGFFFRAIKAVTSTATQLYKKEDEKKDEKK